MELCMRQPGRDRLKALEQVANQVIGTDQGAQRLDLGRRQMQRLAAHLRRLRLRRGTRRRSTVCAGGGPTTPSHRKKRSSAGLFCRPMGSRAVADAPARLPTGLESLARANPRPTTPGVRRHF